MTEASYRIWYPGDFELYHAMKKNFSRIERVWGQIWQEPVSCLGSQSYISVGKIFCWGPEYGPGGRTV